MDRPPLALPLPLPRPRPGEAIVATALAGALGVATWACMPFVMARGGLTPVVAVLVSALAFHWLWRGLPTAANSPERSLPATTTFRRIGARPFAIASRFSGSGVARDGGPPSIGGHGLLHAALAAATIGAVVAIGAPWGDGIVLRAAVGFAVGALLGALVWGPLGALVILGYGLPLRAATGGMDAAYPDVVDRALVRTHRRLAVGAVLPWIVGVGGFFRAPAFDGLPSLALAVFLLLGGAAIAIPARAARLAQRRLDARAAQLGRDFKLLPILPEEAERPARLPILGEAGAPTHLVVPIAAVASYRRSATPEAPVALFAAADTSAKDR